MTAFTVYKAASGHGVAGGSQSALDPQPISPGLQYIRRQYAGNGVVVDEGPHILLSFNLPMTVAQLQTIYTLLGLTSAAYANVSVTIPDEGFNQIVRDGVAVRPEIPNDGRRSGYFLQGVTILVKNLQEQS